MSASADRSFVEKIALDAAAELIGEQHANNFRSRMEPGTRSDLRRPTIAVLLLTAGVVSIGVLITRYRNTDMNLRDDDLRALIGG